ncbi:MAG: hypothetical protein RL516_2187 [Bacteroidota bacterium]|jgi:hypothetical protein
MKLFKTLYLLISTPLFGCNSQPSINKDLHKPSINIESTKAKAKQALDFCKSKNYNSSFCILIDMSLHSGVKRLMIWDFERDTITNSFLVAHGCGNTPWNEDNTKESPVFSNTDNSHCSSLGKYKIGERGYSQWGVNIKYVLHGLESSNSNAQRRAIVFHSWEAIPDNEVHPNGTPEGWGCPAVSNNCFRIIDPLIQSSNQPVLMWIYQ